MLGFNPYAAPTASLEAPPRIESEAETIRRDYLQREACAKGLGLIFYGIAVALAGAAALLTLLAQPDSPGPVHVIAAIVLGMVAVWMALGLRRLERRSRLCLAPFAALLLFFIPFGTAVAFWIFRQFLSRKGSVVFSEDYQKIIAQTPGISPRLSPLNMLMLGLALISGATPIFMYVDWIT